MSDDGNIVAFESSFRGLIDMPGIHEDVYIRNIAEGTTSRISLTPTGEESNGGSRLGVSISADGRFILYTSTASDLVNVDSNGNVRDAFKYDTQTGETELVSLFVNTQSVSDSFAEDISDDGRYVVFRTNLSIDSRIIVRRDTLMDTFDIVSIPESGSLQNRADEAKISGDGRYVFFSSDANDLVANDTNNDTDLFRYDADTEEVVRVNLNSLGEQANDSVEELDFNISSDGRYAVFATRATNLVSDDTNNQTVIYRRDMQTGITTRVSFEFNGAPPTLGSFRPSISNDGRYVVYHSESNTIVDNDSNSVNDVFRYDVQTGSTIRLSVSGNDEQATSFTVNPVISGNGDYVVFESDAENLIENDTNGGNDIFRVRNTTP